MTVPFPESLTRLLGAAAGPAQDEAWAGFLAEHQEVLLFVARRLGGGHDAVMDRFAWMLEGLRRDDFHRLRGYDGRGPGPFRTWLIVVGRRLCLDHHRSRYGRQQTDTSAADAERLERRRLVDLVGEELALDLVAEPGDRAADRTLARAEILSALGRALEGLEVEDRVLLRIRFEDGISVPAMARSLGQDSPFALYRRLDRILKALRDRLREFGIDDANA